MNIIAQLIINPAILSLIAGALIGLFSKATLSGKMIDAVAIYLIFTIGFKGGACLGAANQCTPPLLLLAGIGIVAGFLQPFLHYFLLRKTTKLDLTTAAVVAAEYGSISIVTFMTAISFLTERGIAFDTFMPAIAGLMEIPAIFSGLFIIKHQEKDGDRKFFASLWTICKAIITCRKISFIFIGFFTGMLSHYIETNILETLVITPFNFVLVLFMLDIGMKIGQQIEHIKKFSPALIAFAFYMPIINGCLGLFIGLKLAPFLGSAILFALLFASASYIAVPAVMSTQTPDAIEAIYLPMALGLTLPFNILIGLPLYYYLAHHFS